MHPSLCTASVTVKRLPFVSPGPVLPVLRASRRAVCVHRQLQWFLHRAGWQQHGSGVSPPAQRDHSWLWWGEEAVVFILVINVIALMLPCSLLQSLIWWICLEGFKFKLVWFVCFWKDCWALRSRLVHANTSVGLLAVVGPYYATCFLDIHNHITDFSFLCLFYAISRVSAVPPPNVRMWNITGHLMAHKYFL